MPRRALVAGGLLLAGCAGAPLPTADPPASDQAACRALVASLPDRLDRAENSGRSEYAAAWGDPRIVLRCGVPTPAAYQPESELVVINDVSWLPEQQDSGYTFTAVGRTPQVAVYVPGDYAPEVNPLVDLAESVQSGTRVSGVAGAAP